MKQTTQNRVTESGDVFLYGVIGEPMDGLDASTLVEQLDALGNVPLTVHINSGGGFVFEGLAIYNRLAQHPEPVTVHIDGIAASMASVIAMAGDIVTMPENASLMIHNPWDISIGDSEQLRKDAKKLDGVKSSLVGIYSKKTGLTASRIKVMMNEETWLDAQTALDMRFVDQITEPARMAASIDLTAFNFRHLPNEVKDMSTKANQVDDAVKAERLRINSIRAFGTKLGMEDDTINELIETGVTVDQAKAQLADAWAEQVPQGNQINANRSIAGGGENTFDNPEFRVKAMSEALAARFAPIKPSEAAREFTNMRVLDMARYCLEANGLNTRHMSPGRTIQAALTHSTGDFSELLTGTGDRILRNAYEAAPAGVKMIARPTTAQDFRAKSKLKLGEAPELKEVRQGAEYTYGSMGEAKETYQLATYGRLFGITRQALINDDLGAFADAATRFGRAAAEFEAKFMADLFLSNPTMQDGTALFHADHGNLAGTGGTMTVATLDAARQGMRLQKGLDGKTPINTAPKYLLVPASLETLAEQLVAQISPIVADDVNPFMGKLQVIVEPRLDATSTTAYYLVSDYNVIDTLEYAHLEETQGPEFFMKEGWAVDGIEFKIRDDFGAGVIDWRGFYKNSGA